eukprot:TRINITY_DN3712_c0_g1_i16.p1 TRINITY_DN3712_c0_g1~~TRINITY_DN3712_c0_g1_i16.p1  ORF type:complete len:439 (-),score=108.69 TRINITY_DN3712_c0_g1_i16:731-1984(-)
MATTSVYNEKLFDVFISYALEDADLVEANLAANLEHGATSYRLCLHQRDFPPTTPLADTVSVAVETSTRAVIALSRSYLLNQWPNIRPSFMKAIKDNNTKVIFVLLEDVDLVTGHGDLRQLRDTSASVHWQDQEFWSKFRYFLPEPVYLTFHRSVTMRGTLQNNCNLYQPVMHPYPPRIQLLATKMLANTGHNSLEGDHSTDTTTMTAVSNGGGADSSGVSGSGGNNLGVGGSMYATAGSEHTYHSIDNNHIYHTLDPGPPALAANLFHLQFTPNPLSSSTNNTVSPANNLELVSQVGVRNSSNLSSDQQLLNHHHHPQLSGGSNSGGLAQHSTAPAITLSPFSTTAVHHNRASGRNTTSVIPPPTPLSSMLPQSTTTTSKLPTNTAVHHHTPSNSTCSAKRLLSGSNDDTNGEYIV